MRAHQRRCRDKKIEEPKTESMPRYDSLLAEHRATGPFATELGPLRYVARKTGRTINRRVDATDRWSTKAPPSPRRISLSLSLFLSRACIELCQSRRCKVGKIDLAPLISVALPPKWCGETNIAIISRLPHQPRFLFVIREMDATTMDGKSNRSDRPSRRRCRAKMQSRE